MRRHIIVLVLAWVFLTTLRPETVDRIRGLLLKAVPPPLSALQGDGVGAELETLRLENQRLRAQVDFLSNLDRYYELLVDHLEQLKGYVCVSGMEQRATALTHLLKRELCSLPAHVVYRPASAWNHVCWVDVGRRHHIVKGSPVVVGTSLVGLVDYVGQSRSRVRLITDSAMHPAVRAVRGGAQDRELLMHIAAVQEGIASRGDLFTSDTAAGILMENLNILKERLDPDAKGVFLAKGELCGAVNSRFRTAGSVLLGKGFNYEVADAEGPARDLRTGEVVATDVSEIPIIQEGDLLVTSGLDGVFPEGLSVATVSVVHRLAEGAYCYTVTATATAGDFNELTRVTILPPDAGKLQSLSHENRQRDGDDRREGDPPEW